jgi:dimethylamine/trimethylamine dehydrogenase
MGPVLAVSLFPRVCPLEFVTPSVKAVERPERILGLGIIARWLLNHSVALRTSETPKVVTANKAVLDRIYTGSDSALVADAGGMETSHPANDGLYRALKSRLHGLKTAGIETINSFAIPQRPNPLSG